VSGWRKYSDEQWMRLGRSVEGKASIRRNREYLLALGWFFAPLVVLAAFLASPVSPVGGTAKEKHMRLFSIEAAAATALVTGTTLAQSSTIIAWGRSNEGQAVFPPALRTPVQISAGLYHSLAIDAAGRVFAWGWNSAGQTDVPTIAGPVRQVSASWQHSVALSQSGRVFCWGANSRGQCAVPATLPVIRAIGTGDEFTLAVTADGLVHAWGWNGQGQTTLPKQLANVVETSGGNSHALARRADGTVVAWGNDGFGASIVPAGLSGVAQIVAGAWHSIALKSDRTVVCWGRNEFGQLNVPTGLTNVVAISGEHSNVTMVLLEDGSVRAWGQWNEVFTKPAPPSAAGPWRFISCGGYHAIGVPDTKTCVGDLNADGSIDGGDLAEVLSTWGPCP